MKKIKQSLALLLAVLMMCAMIPAAMADDGSVALGRAKLGDAVLEQAVPASFTQLRSLSGDSASKDLNETGFWQRLPRNTLVGIGTVTPVNYAVPTEGSVTVSNPGVIGDFSFSLEPWAGSQFTTNPPCLQFNYTALSTGTTTVTLKYYYNYGLINIQGGCTWYEETATFTVSVSDQQISDSKPEKPTVSDLERFHNRVNKTSYSEGAVYLWCSTFNHQVWFNYVTDVEGAYTLGEVTANDGSVLSKYTYPWVCTMTLDAQAYLDAYNYELSGDYGTHYLADGEPETQSVTWYYNIAKHSWQYRASDAPVYIDITHAAPVAEYTVTYTDGVNGKAFADQTYTVKEGDATPAFSGTPEREGYVFLGWEPEVAETVTETATYTAKWEEALTDVTVTANVNEGALLFLGSEIKVTAKPNTSATVTIAPTLNGAFKQIASSTGADGTKTIWYRVTKITGYSRLSFTATAVKGSQDPVSSTLTFGVNLRNRVHVTLKYSNGDLITDATNVKLHHKWNCGDLALSYDAAKGEYAAKPWDLGVNDYDKVLFTLDGEEYSIDKDVKGRDLYDLFRSGEEEIYVEYTIANPIVVTINVDGVKVAERTYKGSMGETLDYGAFQAEILLSYLHDMNGLSVIGLNDSGEAVFGECESVILNVQT